MCEPTSIFMAVTAVAGGMKAYGQYKEGAATNKYMKTVAGIQNEQGEIALKRGEKQSELIQDAAKFQGKQQKTEAAQVASAQRATMVANGISLDSVTAQDLATETISNARLDELVIRYNADVSSWNTSEDAKFKKWSFDTQAYQSRNIGVNAKASGKRQAFTTLLSTAASIAGGAIIGKALTASKATAVTGGGGGGGGGGGLLGSQGPHRTTSFLVR